MPTAARRTRRRDDALSRERIVNATVELLDNAGEAGLTVRALTAHLDTGAGAVYWHVGNKGELLAAATEAVLDTDATAVDAAGDPDDLIRRVALTMFDAIDAHPWIGTQLARNPVQPAMVRIYEHIGQQLRRLDVAPELEFTCASVLMNYILGVGGQNAANASTHDRGHTRADFLDRASAAWADLDPTEFPFTTGVAAQLPDHDDRAQFLAGINLVLAGIRAST